VQHLHDRESLLLRRIFLSHNSFGAIETANADGEERGEAIVVETFRVDDPVHLSPFVDDPLDNNGVAKPARLVQSAITFLISCIPDLV